MRAIGCCAIVAAFTVAPAAAAADDAEAATAAPTLGTYGWGQWGGGGMFESEAGFSWYTAVFKWFDEGHSIDLGLGTGSAWFRRAGHSQPGPPTGNGNHDLDPSTSCACGGLGGGAGNCCKMPGGDNTSCGWLFQSIEGGPGYWTSGQGLPTTEMKWRIGDSTGCYSAYTGSPMFQFGGYSGHVCEPVDPGIAGGEVGHSRPGSMGFAQLSNRMIMFPDGISLSRYGLLGVAYVRTPFGKKDANDTRNFWTVALDSTTFSGPVGYFLPEFWKLRPYAMVNQTKDFPDFGTVHRINVTGGAYEIDSVPTFNGTTAFRLPKMSMPIVDGRSTLFAGQRGYTNAQVYDPLEAALAPVAAPIDPSKLMTGGKATGCGGAGNRSAFVFGGGLGGRQDGGHEVLFGRHVETIDEADGGTCTWSVEHLNASCCGTMECGMPQYIDANSMLPIQPEAAPASLQSAVFPETQKTGPYDVLTKAPKGGCRDTPGPAAPGTLYCVQSTSPSWVAYRWYKFVDQPGLQQAKLSDTEKAFMQGRVETLHKMLPTEKAGWLKPGEAIKNAGIAAVDIAAIVTPPAGLEHGYVPIALYEGIDKPPGCQAFPKPGGTLPPMPPPPPPPVCPAPPPTNGCAGRCLAAGHCCVGTVSSDGTTSCGQGCIVGNYSKTVAECQATCREYGNSTTHTCTWTVGGHQMTNCGSCPGAGCNAADGPNECEAGCVFAFAARTNAP